MINNKFYILISSLDNYNNYLFFNGDWGLGIGDWAQSPIPNPQSPIKLINIFIKVLLKIYIKYVIFN